VRQLLLRIAGWGYLGGLAVSIICLISSAVTKDYGHATLCLGIFLFSFFAPHLTVLADVWLSKKSRKTKWATTHEVTTGFGAMEAAFRYLLR
jgi:hypothetical protein